MLVFLLLISRKLYLQPETCNLLFIGFIIMLLIRNNCGANNRIKYSVYINIRLIYLQIRMEQIMQQHQ